MVPRNEAHERLVASAHLQPNLHDPLQPVWVSGASVIDGKGTHRPVPTPKDAR